MSLSIKPTGNLYSLVADIGEGVEAGTCDNNSSIDIKTQKSFLLGTW